MTVGEVNAIETAGKALVAVRWVGHKVYPGRPEVTSPSHGTENDRTRGVHPAPKTTDVQRESEDLGQVAAPIDKVRVDGKLAEGEGGAGRGPWLVVSGDVGDERRRERGLAERRRR